MAKRGSCLFPFILGVVAIAIVVGAAIFLPPQLLRHRADFPFERQAGNMAIRMAAGDLKNATNPQTSDRRALENGRQAYNGSCAICHGTNGDGKGAFGQAIYPPAPDFKDPTSRDLTDGEKFWVIKNGLSFVGMPAFGGSYDDQAIWSMVIYIRALQQGQAQAPAIPPATPEQLVFANPQGTPEQRGAAHYFAQGCALCHGAVGNAPGDLRINNSREANEAIRNGKRQGMPKYDAKRLSDAEVRDIIAYINSFARPPAPRPT